MIYFQNFRFANTSFWRRLFISPQIRSMDAMREFKWLSTNFTILLRSGKISSFRSSTITTWKAERSMKYATVQTLYRAVCCTITGNPLMWPHLTITYPISTQACIRGLGMGNVCIDSIDHQFLDRAVPLEAILGSAINLLMGNRLYLKIVVLRSIRSHSMISL